MVKKQNLACLTNEKLWEIIDCSPYRFRSEAIGNNEVIKIVFEILHERKEIDCKTTFCFEGCD